MLAYILGVFVSVSVVSILGVVSCVCVCVCAGGLCVCVLGVCFGKKVSFCSNSLQASVCEFCSNG